MPAQHRGKKQSIIESQKSVKKLVVKDGSQPSNIKQNKEESEDEPAELQLDDAYSDDDFNIYFDRNSLLQHLNNLEDDNLFKINLV